MTLEPPGEHGGDGRLVARSLGVEGRAILDLSVSLNPFAPQVAELAARHLADAVGRYPDRLDRARATTALARALEVEEDRVLLTNGGAEAIALVAAELGRGWVEGPEFSLYARHLGALDPEGPRFRSDPHNPTGRLAASTEQAAAWDEAFYPLATGRWRAPGRPESVVVGSVTKVLACPGLRLGYVVVPADGGAALGTPGLKERLERRQPAWSVWPLALVCLPELLERADVGQWASLVARARTELVGVLRRHGYAPLPSDANFVLVPRAAGLRAALARQRVVVRDCTSFGLADHVRIAVPDEAGLERLDRALAACGDRCPPGEQR